MTKPIILIIDDSEDDALLMEVVISRIAPGLRTKSVTSGEAGLEFLLNADPLPSIVLLDFKMPGMNGIETLRRIRSDKRLRTLPVVIVTNSALEADRQASFAAGADEYLQKANDLDHFRSDIAGVLGCWVAEVAGSSDASL